MKFFNFKHTALGVQCSCYGLGCIGFFASPKDINNKFNRGSSVLKVVKYENEEPFILNIVLGDYVDTLVLFEYIKRFRFITPVELSFYSAMRNGRRHFLMRAKLC